MQQSAIHSLFEENGELEILSYHKGRVLLIVLPRVIGRCVVDGAARELPAPLVDGNYYATINKLDRYAPALVVEDVSSINAQQESENAPLYPRYGKVEAVTFVKIPGHDPLKEIIGDDHLI